MLRKDSFIDPDLQQHFSDLLYQAESQAGEITHIYLLLEHKSTPSPQAPFQLLRYLVRIWEQDLRQGDDLSPIIPVVVYHGQEKWRVATDFDEIFPGPAALRPYWPSFRYELTDLSTYSDAEIEGSAFLQIGLMVLKYIYDPNLGERLPALSALFRRLANTETALEYLRTVLIYVAAANDRVTESDLATAVDTALPQRRGEIMPTLVEKWIEHGKKEGLELGLEKGLEKGLQQGREQGLEQGREQGLEQSIHRLLTRRFGPPPPSVTAELEALSAPVLEQVLDAAIETPDMEAFTNRLTSITSTESA